MYSLNVSSLSLCGKLDKIRPWAGVVKTEKDWFVQQSNSKSFRKSILKLSLAAAVYYLWGGRNSRIFQMKVMDACALSSKIRNAIRDCMLPWRRVK